MGSGSWLVKHGNKILVRDAFFEQSLLELLTRVVDELIEAVSI